MSQNKPTNYREKRKRHDRELLYLVIAVLVLGGGGLIALIWGSTAAVLSILCLGAGAALIVGLWLLLNLLEKFVDN